MAHGARRLAKAAWQSCSYSDSDRRRSRQGWRYIERGTIRRDRRFFSFGQAEASPRPSSRGVLIAAMLSFGLFFLASQFFGILLNNSGVFSSAFMTFWEFVASRIGEMGANATMGCVWSVPTFLPALGCFLYSRGDWSAARASCIAESATTSFAACRSRAARNAANRSELDFPAAGSRPAIGSKLA